ncbi:MAG: hypothetical protein OK454_05405 [Thaumarchaeota archaeon]|nr:hypothetical protein [Nitrososphaerota archaeon]
MNPNRTARVAEVLDDFRTLQLYIAAAPVNPDDMDDYYTEGWAALRQCALDGQHILECAADTRVPVVAGGPEEQTKAELRQCVLFLLSLLSLRLPELAPPPFSLCDGVDGNQGGEQN